MEEIITIIIKKQLSLQNETSVYFNDNDIVGIVL